MIVDLQEINVYNKPPEYIRFSYDQFNEDWSIAMLTLHLEKIGYVVARYTTANGEVTAKVYKK